MKGRRSQRSKMQGKCRLVLGKGQQSVGWKQKEHIKYQNQSRKCSSSGCALNFECWSLLWTMGKIAFKSRKHRFKQGCVGNEAAVKSVLCWTLQDQGMNSHLLRELALSILSWPPGIASPECISPGISMWVHLQGLPRFWAPHGISWSLCCDDSSSAFVPHRIVYLFLQLLTLRGLLHSNLPPHHLGLFPRESDLQ